MISLLMKKVKMVKARAMKMVIVSSLPMIHPMDPETASLPEISL
jgi:hypothetical protein